MDKLVTQAIELSFISESDSKFTFPIIDAQRDYLREWLPWVDTTTSEQHLKSFYKFCQQKKLDNNGFECLIKFQGIPIGQIGLHKIDSANKCTSIGYWLSEKYQGKGIITQSCKALIDYCFDELSINRIEIKCAIENKKSNKIPLSLSFRHEGILKGAELLNGQFIDANLYAITKTEWKSQQ